MKKSRPRFFLPVILLTLLPLTGAVSGANPPSQASKAADTTRKGTLVNLKSIAPLKEAFQRDSGKIRLVALVSPT